MYIKKSMDGSHRFSSALLSFSALEVVSAVFLAEELNNWITTANVKIK